ncbi:hypothetical protein ACFSL4_15295 [Streptomyces caeni]|uniref:Restriction endonuclease type IV Mrr domain-containing protein n=1 Tax=Streptomyces caeni TaxID=2307231 RepID=A0ABW4IS14_9ACTN
MPESVPVRCPACRREHLYTVPSYPCACGAPVAPPLNRLSEPSVVTHRTWDDDWVAVRCTLCGREDQWPQPDLGCPCGAILRVPVNGAVRPLGEDGPPPGGGEAPMPPRAAFQPVAIRTARDAVTAAALYLRWLGYRDVRRADRRQPNGIGLAARGVLAQVDPTVRPASPRDVECLWLTALSESARSVYFSLSGYADDARGVADRLGVPLFVLDLSGTPQPVNSPADELVADRA